MGLVPMMDTRHPLRPFDETLIVWCVERQLPLPTVPHQGAQARAQTLRRALQMPEGASVMALPATEGASICALLHYNRPISQFRGLGAR